MAKKNKKMPKRSGIMPAPKSTKEPSHAKQMNRVIYGLRNQNRR